MLGVLGTGQSLEEAQQIVSEYVKGQSAIGATLSSESGKPVVGGTFCDRSELFVRELQDRGMTVLPSPERGVVGLGALYRYSKWRKIFS